MIPDGIQAMIETYPNFLQCSLQTFDDVKTRGDKQYAKIFSNKEGNYQSLVDLNVENAGIFFSVNPMIEGKRNIESVVSVSSWICEIDGLDKEVQRKLIKNCPLKPSLIIESKSSFHLYWFAKDGTKERWYDIANGLRNYFDGDPAVVDISRVLRLPGFYHCKDPDDRFMCSIDDYSGKYFTESEMLKAYSDTRSVSEIKSSLIEKEYKAKQDIGGDYFWDRVKNMDTKNMLDEISGSQFVSGDSISFTRNNNGTEQIWVNGRSTGCWIDVNGKIGSNAGGGPNRTNWVFRYGNCTGKEIAKRIRDKHPEMCESKVIPQKKPVKPVVVQEDKEDIDFDNITPFTWGLQSIDKRFGRFDYYKMIVTLGESQSGKTEFTFFQARRNADRGRKVCYLALEMNKQQMILRICQKSAGISKEERDDKKFTPRQKDIMKAKYNELQTYKNLEIVYIAKPTIEDIEKTILEKFEEGYELFYIDNLGFITGDVPEIELTALAIRSLKDITNQYKLSINLIHHFNKGTSKDRVGPRGMASIRSSGKIENDVDYALQVRRDLDEEISVEERKKVGIFLQKDRVWGDPSACWVEFDRGDYVEHIEHKEHKEQSNPF